MKIKLRTKITYSYTLTSPYPGEVGRHKHENVIACCGNCGKSIEEAHFYHSWNYCPYCGEAIDWPEDESSHR